tara:strand:+ start:242013 stop:244019 length:2007 start_codon:yes stop_codon:yes gene_type:complete
LRSKLVLTSTLLTFLVLLIVSSFFTYEYSLLAKERKLIDLTKEFEVGVSTINEYLNSKKNEIDFLSGINLIRVSLDFSRKEELSEFLRKYVDRYQNYTNIIVLDANKKLFASKFSVFDKEGANKLTRDISKWEKRILKKSSTYISLPSNREGETLVISQINDVSTLGYVVAIVDKSAFNRIRLNLKQRLDRFDSFEPIISLVKKEDIQKRHQCLGLSDDIFLNQNNIAYCLVKKDYTFSSEILNVIYVIIISILLLLPIYYFFYNLFVTKLIDNFNAIISRFESISKGSYDKLIDVKVPELQPLNNITDSIIGKLKDREKLIADKIRVDTIDKINQQVSHDIRSPLAALEVVQYTNENLNEDTRIIFKTAVTRIKDIVNDLATKKEVDDKKINIELISSVLESIVSEKRTQYRALKGVSIELFLSQLNYGFFSAINVSEFKRLLSNIINNSVDALNDEVGSIKINIKKIGDIIQISIQDDGSGIEKEKLEQVFERGVSFKDNTQNAGSGLGLYHAKKCVESWGGTIAIDSELGVGTRITIQLKSSDQPSWFVPSINLKKNIAIIDDDDSIHQIWKKRLDEYDLNVTNIKNIHEFNAPLANIELYLVDYEFKGAQKNGLDLISEYNLEDKAILITSHYEDEEVRSIAKALGVKIIPKGLAAYVPLNQYV